MFDKLRFSVPGGTEHLIPFAHLSRMQEAVELLGAEDFPLLMRLGAVDGLRLQPVRAGVLHDEALRASQRLVAHQVPTLTFHSPSGAALGSLFGGQGEADVAASDSARVSLTPRGIRIALRQFPPPVGFRSTPGLERGWFACFFASLRFGEDGICGLRTPEMGGSGAPVLLPELPKFPPVTRWHRAFVAGRPDVAEVRFAFTPAQDVFRDVLHALTAATQESLRLKRALEIHFE
ncbi:hypothetical protein [Symbiobacterium thermophilum]|uniref:hypothetical protein n=1 Tax=Symbiobacterium thermophilum TaxID=2734 RepID=UPI0035C71D3E